MTSVLAVDDSASMRAMLASTLRQAGYDVVEAVDGLDALEKLQGRPVDVVLTDHNMPRMDGVELTRSLRGQEKFRRLPILILTTDSDDRTKQAGREAGATGWLAKPFDPARLIATIRKVAPQEQEPGHV
ncbi:MULTISPECIES: response regulator [Ramlibacter]|uniref:Response regulator n=1 Tax=Ramlibacter aquaticus TaxID=2780094 RepID=A0ABR9SAN9_9BURK|nr:MULTISPECIES: response regulator [Ramlibacter]MBE7939284.1 response regulator [Ramlibacter aquaticus]